MDNAGSHQTHVVIVGGGTAGMSAAIELAARGIKVTVLEGAEVLGGKVKGWRDTDGDSLEHGLHGWWLDYTNFRDLLMRVGLASNLTEPPNPFRVIHRTGVVEHLTFSGLPSPFHVFGMLRGLRSLTLRARLSAGPVTLAIVAFDPNDDFRRLDGIDLRTWLRSKGASSSIVEAVIEPIVRANLFLPLERVSAAAGVNALLRGSRRSQSWRFEWLRGNTGDYLWAPFSRYLANRGGQVRLQSRVTGLRVEGGRVRGVLVSEKGGAPANLSADHVILATDIESCKHLVRQSLAQMPFFSRIFNLTTTDVLVTRTWFQGEVRLRYREAMLRGFRVVDSFTDLTRFQCESARPGLIVIETQSYLGKEWMAAPEAVIRAMVLADLSEALPELQDAFPAKTVVLKHPGLFTAFGVGFEASRPSPRTSIPNLHLAGDWVRAEEPVMFMENAIVTGRHAASAVVESLGQPAVPVLSPPPADWPVVVLQRCARGLRRFRAGVDRLVGFKPIGTGESL